MSGLHEKAGNLPSGDLAGQPPTPEEARTRSLNVYRTVTAGIVPEPEYLNDIRLNQSVTGVRYGLANVPSPPEYENYPYVRAFCVDRITFFPAFFSRHARRINLKAFRPEVDLPTYRRDSPVQDGIEVSDTDVHFGLTYTSASLNEEDLCVRIVRRDEAGVPICQEVAGTWAGNQYSIWRLGIGDALPAMPPKSDPEVYAKIVDEATDVIIGAAKTRAEEAIKTASPAEARNMGEALGVLERL